MRSFADTLPTLRDSGALVPPPPMVKENRAFDPLLLTRHTPRPPAPKAKDVAAARPGATAGGESANADSDSGGASGGEAPTTIADIRRALLERQESGAASHAADRDGTAADAAHPENPASSGGSLGEVALLPGAAPAVASAAPAVAKAEAKRPATAGPRPASAVVPPFVTGLPGSDGKHITVEQQIAQAVAAAKEEAEADKAAAVEFARKVERDVATRAVADAREAWCRDEGEAFAKRCEEAFDALHQRLSGAFARALAPIAESAIRDAAVRRFAAVLDDLVGAASNEPALKVTGPAALISALRQASGDNAVAFEEAPDQSELSVTVGETTLTTTIDTWADTLAEALGVTRSGEDNG